MKALFLAIAAPFFLHAEEPKPHVARRTLPIAGRWNLTAASIEKTKTDGSRTLLLTASGQPTLKRGANAIKGPWEIEAKAERIECDFVAKKFILTGSPEVRRRATPPATGWVTLHGELATIVELGLSDDSAKTEGPSKETTEE